MNDRDSPVDRLTPSDAAVIYAEDPQAPAHVGGVVVLDVSAGFDYRRVVEIVRERLSTLPRFRQVVRSVPGRMARPVWVDDDSFDLGYHVRRTSLPTPGGDEELAELVGRLASRPLDHRHPLWELYIVEGLADGRVALVNKTHEVLVDHVGAIDIAAAIVDDRERDAVSEAVPWIPTPAPSPVDLVVDAVADLVARPTEAMDAARLAVLDMRSGLRRVVNTALAVADVVQRSARPAAGVGMRVPVAGPRHFATSVIDLTEVKDIRTRSGVSVNDVILAVVTGALRSWLLSRGEPVGGDATVRALAPMSVATTGTDAADVISHAIDLPIGEPNPTVRLHQIAYHMREHSESGQSVGADVLVALGRLAPPTLHGLGARVAGQLSRRSYDMLVTNVPGPQTQLYVGTYPVAAMFPVVPLAKGHLLAVGCTSYRGAVHVGITVDGDADAHASEFGRLIGEAVAELAGAAPGRRARRPARRQGPRRTGT